MLVVSQRAVAAGLGRSLAYASWYEAEDVLADVTGADVLAPEWGIDRHSMRVRRALGRQLRRSARGSTVPPQRSQRSSRTYDLAVVVALTPWDLTIIEALGLRARCDRIVAYFPEVWPSELHDPRLRHEPWHLIDDIFVAIHPTVADLAAMLDRDVHYLPMAADVSRFAPAGLAMPRPIDVLDIGRRLPHLHDALRGWAWTTGHYYVFDTFRIAELDDPLIHRAHLGQQYARTSVAMCNHAKHDLPAVTRGRRLIPQRLWEGLAGGAAMIGLAPEATLQHLAVGEVVVEDLPADIDDAVGRIAELVEGDADLVRRRNLDLALRRHDWSHRWSSMLATLGHEAPDALTARVAALTRQADELARDTLAQAN